MSQAIPFVEAKGYTKVDGTRTIRVIVIHDMEAPEKGTTAEAVAAFFASGKVKASAHYNLDNDSVVQSVKDNDVAWAAPGSNHDGLHFEHAGFASQNKSQWLDPFGQAMLKNSAKLVAKKLVTYHLQPKHLTNDELRHGETGIVGHKQVSAVYKQSTHTDPGDGFPWTWYMALVRVEYDKLTAKPTLRLSALKQSALQEPGKPNLNLHPKQVRLLATLLIKEGLLSPRYLSGHYSRPKKRAYKAWQAKVGASAKQQDGIPGAFSLQRLGDKHGVRVVV